MRTSDPAGRRAIDANRCCRTSRLCAALVVSLLAVPSFADGAKKYHVTGTVTELTAGKVVITKADGERWELQRDAAAATNGELAIGRKVTIRYTTTVASIEAKPTRATTRP